MFRLQNNAPDDTTPCARTRKSLQQLSQEYNASASYGTKLDGYGGRLRQCLGVIRTHKYTLRGKVRSRTRVGLLGHCLRKAWNDRARHR